MTEKELTIVHNLLDKVFSVLQESSGIFNNDWGNPLYPVDSYSVAVRELGRAWQQTKDLLDKNNENSSS